MFQWSSVQQKKAISLLTLKIISSLKCFPASWSMHPRPPPNCLKTQPYMQCKSQQDQLCKQQKYFQHLPRHRFYFATILNWPLATAAVKLQNKPAAAPNSILQSFKQLTLKRVSSSSLLLCQLSKLMGGGNPGLIILQLPTSQFHSNWSLNNATYSLLLHVEGVCWSIQG